MQDQLIIVDNPHPLDAGGWIDVGARSCTAEYAASEAVFYKKPLREMLTRLLRPIDLPRNTPFHIYQIVLDRAEEHYAKLINASK